MSAFEVLSLTNAYKVLRDKNETENNHQVVDQQKSLPQKFLRLSGSEPESQGAVWLYVEATWFLYCYFDEFVAHVEGVWLGVIVSGRGGLLV